MTESTTEKETQVAPKKSRLLPKIALGLVAAIGLFVIVVTLQPDDFRISRSITINAPAADIFPHVDNLKDWEAWSPFEELDREMKKTFEGPAAGTGAKSSWVGNSQAGEGSTTILESRTDELIRIKLEMRKPFAAVNDVRFTFKPEGKQTVVTWDMTGKLTFLPKIFHLLMSMDKMVGGQFEKGLTSLKSLVEKSK